MILDVPPGSPTANHFRVAVIGAGFAGLGMAIRLQQENTGPFVVFERLACRPTRARPSPAFRTSSS